MTAISRMQVALLVLCCAGSALAAAPIRVAVQEDSAPKFVSAQEHGGGAAGICPDVLRAIEKQAPGLSFVFELRAQPLRRLETLMEQGQQDANCLVDTAERRARFHVSPTPLFRFDYHLIARSDDPVRVDAWDDVRRLGADGKILVVSGTGVIERLQRVGGLVLEESGKSAVVNLRKLVMGRGRFFYYRTYDWNSQVRAAMVTGQVRVLPASMESVRFHLMLGNHVPREVQVRIDRALQELDANGTLARLRSKWLLANAASTPATP